MGDREKQPTVLLLAATRWISTGRLVLAFREFGCRVEMWAPRDHPAFVTGEIARRMPIPVLRPVRGMREAIDSSDAAMIVPVDEWTVGWLREMLAREPEGSPLCVRLARCLGDFGNLQLARFAQAELARAQGVPAPETVELHDEADVERVAATWELPFVLKADGTAGGAGVRVLNSEGTALRKWRTLHQPLSLLRTVRRGLRFREWQYARLLRWRALRTVVAQRFVHGAERTVMAVADRGRVTALVALDVERNWFVRGPSSVVRVVDEPAMLEHAQKLCGAMGTTGFIGFDYVVDAEDGTPYLIEINARPTQLAHLPLGPGRDLVAAYVRAVTGVEVADRVAATERECIALFPQEVLRDRQSEALVEGFHDVPWECPALVRKALGRVPAVIRGDVRWGG